VLAIYAPQRRQRVRNGTAIVFAGDSRAWLFRFIPFLLLYVPAWAQMPITPANMPQLSAYPPRSSADVKPDNPQPSIRSGLNATQSTRRRTGFPVGVGESFRDCAVCPEMVVIPPGRFVMGSPPAEPGHDSAETPQRPIVAREPLAVGKFEVTNAEWNACVAARGCTTPNSPSSPAEPDFPVVGVDWYDGQQYVRWLTRLTGRTYRLLTEAEWEYAARAGTTTAYPWGDIASPEQANYSQSALGRTTTVGSYPPNAWGLHDMHGNVYEWVQDCYAHGYTQSKRRTSDWVARNRCYERVIRGGSWQFKSDALRSSARTSIPTDDGLLRAVVRAVVPPWHEFPEIGLRVARTR
jgi:formylglycine-generating enzyme required for sulfatase activity